MYDLMYCGSDRDHIETLVKTNFPLAKITDASDFVHEGRFAVECDIEDKKWFLWLLRNGLFNCSFHWQLHVIENREGAMELVKQVVGERKNATTTNEP